MKTIVVNLLGAAGSGKSVLASEVFSKLKKEGYNCEYVSEFVKQSVYEGNYTVLKNQLYVLANQYYHIDLLRDKVDIIVTDSPLLLSIFYNNNFDKANSYKIPDELFRDLIMYVHSTFDNLNFFIKRNHPYKKEGRYQDESLAREEEGVMQKLLSGLGINVRQLLSTDNCAQIIVDAVKNRCEFYKTFQKSGKEIERKFLVHDIPFSLNKMRSDSIVQGYLDSNENEIRIRAVNANKFYLTQKYGSGINRDEYEKELTPDEFYRYAERIKGKLIQKRRYYVDLGQKTAELDLYLDDLSGLKTVEVEFASIEEADSFLLPDWFGKEITCDTKYKNYALATRQTGILQEMGG